VVAVSAAAPPAIAVVATTVAAVAMAARRRIVRDVRPPGHGLDLVTLRLMVTSNDEGECQSKPFSFDQGSDRR